MDDSIKNLKRQQEDIQAIFTTDNGKRVLKNLEDKFYVNNTTFRYDENALAYNEGQRTVILYIKNMLEMDVEKLVKEVQKHERNP